VTNTQLYLAIGVPMVFNAAITISLILFVHTSLNRRIDDLTTRMSEGYAAMNQRFDDLRDLWRAKLRRVEEVLDARLKHLEERESR
jgi:hypothetical protein